MTNVGVLVYVSVWVCVRGVALIVLLVLFLGDECVRLFG